MPGEDLVDDALAQLMRCVREPTWVEQMLAITPGSAGAAALVGRLLGPDQVLDPSTPLARWAGLGSGATHPSWEPTLPGSLYADWLTACALAGVTPATRGREMYAQWRALVGAEPESTSPDDGDARRQGDT